MISKISLLLVVAVSFTAARPTSIDDENSELVLVHAIFRHGARTTDFFYPNDPYRNETFYPIGLGGLTNSGKTGEYRLGQFLRNHYGALIGDIWSRDTLDVRSTSYHRVRMSALLVLAGLYPPKGDQVWNEELQWLPIPVDYSRPDQEEVYHRDSDCKYKASVMEDLPNIKEVQDKFIKPHADLYEKVTNGTGRNISNPYDLSDIYFILKTEADLNYTLPTWTNDIFPQQIDEVASQYYAYQNHDQAAKRINAGYLLKKIIQDSRDKIANEKNQKKIYLYSGHENTIGYMLTALNVPVSRIPPYSTSLIFEVRKAQDKHYIKLRFRNDTYADDPIDITLDGCETLCEVNKFEQLNIDVLPTISMQEACDQPYHKNVYSY